MNNIEFGKYIAELREKAGYETQAALGKVAGVENSTLSRIETGDTKNPSVSTLKKLAPLLGVPIEEIMGKLGYIMTKTKQIAENTSEEKSEMLEVLFNVDSDDIKLFTRISKLSPASKVAITSLVDNLEIIDAQVSKKTGKEA